MRKSMIALGAIAAEAVLAVAWWRRHPRVGAAYVNRVIDPWLVRQGLVDTSRGEIGLLEHVGRVSGTVRRSPVHPVRTATGFRIIVPLGVESQWAQNVLAAGHCRLEVDHVVHELDEPVLIDATAVEAVPRPMARLMGWLGFRYLLLHELDQRPGDLAEAPKPIEAMPPTSPEASLGGPGPVVETRPSKVPVEI
jgi:hypothetical protein